MTVADTDHAQNGEIIGLCIHEMTAQFCSFCKANAPVARRTRAWDLASHEGDNNPRGIGTQGVEASFPMKCPWCSDQVDVGDLIANRMDQWICLGCAEAFDNHPSNYQE